MRWNELISEDEHPNDERNDREYWQDLAKGWKTNPDKKPIFTNWPPSPQEMREAERTIFQDPEWLGYYAYFGWKSFTRIPESNWEWSRDKQCFRFSGVPAIWYLPKRSKLWRSHPQGGETSPDRKTVYMNLDGKIINPFGKPGPYDHMEMILPTALRQLRDFVAMKAPAIKANMQYLQGRYYIRFGKWPENERSQIFGRGWRDHPAQYEKGVSAYHTFFDIHAGRWQIELTMDEATITGTLSSLIYSERPIFLVTGTELKSEGYDGEPLLHDVKMIKQLHKHDVFVDGVFDRREDDAEDLAA